ncbi:MAG: DUF1800 domain-containing protein [Burkholderiales bacterium]|nr:DUF1800 domain-containing protein [Burkholderiales bacterium]
MRAGKVETELLEKTETQTPVADGSPQALAEAFSPARLTSVAAAAALTACGGGGGDSGVAPYVAVPIPGRNVNLSTAGYANTAATTDAEASRFLLHAQFAATDADIAAVRSLGYAGWLERQIATSWTTGWDWLNIQGYGDVQSSNNYYDNSYQTDYMIWNQLMTAPDPLRKRAALALSEFFVVSLNGVTATWVSHIMAHYWDTLCRHALGNYRDLLEAITLNVAMGYYLNTKGNLKENSSGRQPDENYAREVMQLFSLGLVLLNPDGTPQLDASSNPIDTYSASDVSNLARVFTGYDLDQSQNVNTVVGTRTVGSTHFARLPMKQVGSNHSMLEVKLFDGKSYGVTIPANTPALAALKTALDTLFNHPNTAPFFCKQMIQRLVTSNPSPAYVQRVADKFINNGQGVRGDLAYVFAAILMDDEARGVPGLIDPEFGKLREPMLRLVQWVRTFGVTSTSGAWKIGDLSDAGSRIGQSPLRAPSVFNYFRPGYVAPGTTLATGKVAPEFQLVNESSVGGYLNFMMGVITNGVGNIANDAKATYVVEIALATSPSAASPSDLVNRLNLLLCAGQLSAATVNTITAAVGTMSSTSADNKRNRVCATVLLIMACAEYLIQK